MLVRKTQLEQWRRYFEARNAGVSVEKAAARARFSASTAYRFERGDQGSEGLEAAAFLGVSMVAGAPVAQPLREEAKRALEDFAFFRRRYFGRESTPWQTRAAYELLGAMETPDREYVVMNEPPGSGKSTLFTCDIPTWLIVRRRSIRIMLGSRTERQAKAYVNRIRRSLEREVPLKAKSEDLDKGIAFDADACIIDDFGVFKPPARSEKWNSAGFVVVQLDETALDDKEDTCSAYGMDSGYLGGRYDVVIWDDLVDSKNTKTVEARDDMRTKWDDESESRLEPGGTLVLQGQRISPQDLYRYALDKKKIDESPKYRHVVYKAHYEDLCTGSHENLEPWPKSCLLDPHRLPWTGHLETLHHNNPRGFALIYQQEDGDIPNGLVDPAWIRGGLDKQGYPAPGCLDDRRRLLDPPVHLLDYGWSYVTVDPSPTEWWGIIWWLYDPDTENRYIVDLHRKRLNPEDFLSLDLDNLNTADHDPWSGLMHTMYWQSQDMGIPITDIIVETNAAQKWLLNQPHIQRWMSTTGQRFLPHTTHRNKNDPKYGLESIGDLFRQGRIRIPWGDLPSRNVMQYLIDEATRYPDYDTTDLIMSTWFGKLAVENHYTPRRPNSYRQQRPSWMTGARRGIA